MKQVTGYRLQVTVAAAIILLLLLYPNPYTLTPSFAQTAGCTPQTLNPRVQEGLISTPDISTNFSNPGGTCVVDPAKAPFAPFKIPSYDDLKSIYFTQSKSTASFTKEAPLTGDQTEGAIKLTGSSDHLYYVTGNLNINNNIPGNQTGVVFVDGNLTINPSGNKLTTGASAGLVFLVKGDVIIDKSVTQIDAVIISSGTIYTAGADCGTSLVSTANPLIINGSLISLDSSKQINFCRMLSSTSQAAAEQINEQPKYLVILRNLYANTFQKWSEITAESVATQTTTGSTTPTTPTPTLPPATPTPTPSPTPTTTPSPCPPSYCQDSCLTAYGQTWLSQYTCSNPSYFCCSPQTSSAPGEYAGEVRVAAYYDENQNAVWDAGEQAITGLTATVWQNKMSQFLFYQSQKTTSFFTISNGITYTISVLADASEWKPLEGGSKITRDSRNNDNGICYSVGYNCAGSNCTNGWQGYYFLASSWSSSNCQVYTFTDTYISGSSFSTCYGFGPGSNPSAGATCWDNHLKTQWPLEYWLVTSSAYISQPNEVKEINIPFSKPRPISTILINGDFTNQLSNWDCTGDKSGTCIAASDTYSSAPYSAFVKNTGGGWGWQIQQRGISASSNQQFCLSARIKKNSANDMAGVALQEGGSPWREVDILAPNQTGWQMLRQTVQVGSNWVLPVQVFARVWNKDGAVWFDDITLTSGACQ